MRENLLIIFVKNPEAGNVKTRLAATIGNEAAFEIYQKLLHHTLLITSKINTGKVVFFSDFIPEKSTWQQSGYFLQIQQGNNLGERMFNAFEFAFQDGYKRVVLIGSDCFELTDEIIGAAFMQLQYADVVIGPAKDGGYYLIGLNKNYLQLFQNILWSSSAVLKQTIAACNHQNLKYFLLPVLNDIDTEADLLPHQNKVANE